MVSIEPLNRCLSLARSTCQSRPTGRKMEPRVPWCPTRLDFETWPTRRLFMSMVTNNFHSTCLNQVLHSWLGKRHVTAKPELAKLSFSDGQLGVNSWSSRAVARTLVDVLNTLGSSIGYLSVGFKGSARLVDNHERNTNFHFAKSTSTKFCCHIFSKILELAKFCSCFIAYHWAKHNLLCSKIHIGKVLLSHFWHVFAR